MPPLEVRWDRLLAALGCTGPQRREAFEDLAHCYSSPDRHYHTLDHVRDVLGKVDFLCGGQPGPALELAAWFHDVIYDTRATDNEERSAAHARAVLQALGVAEPLLAETGRLILLTKTHRTAADDAAGRVLLDADLAILGADAAIYDEYARAIRREYAWVPVAEYRAGRRRVLEGFLQRPRIYLTERMHNRLEEAARRNLRREVEEL